MLLSSMLLLCVNELITDSLLLSKLVTSRSSFNSVITFIGGKCPVLPSKIGTIFFYILRIANPKFL